MKFEEKKFCKIDTLCHRWDVSPDRVYELLKKQSLKPWHPEKKVGSKGILIDVQSILHVEANGYIDLSTIE